YLRTDYSTQCYTSEYNAYVPAALAGVLLYVIGIPIAFFAILLHNDVPRTAQRKLDQARLNAMVNKLVTDGRVMWDLFPVNCVQLVDLSDRLLLYIYKMYLPFSTKDPMMKRLQGLQVKIFPEEDTLLTLSKVMGDDHAELMRHYDSECKQLRDHQAHSPGADQGHARDGTDGVDAPTGMQPASPANARSLGSSSRDSSQSARTFIVPESGSAEHFVASTRAVAIKAVRQRGLRSAEVDHVNDFVYDKTTGALTFGAEMRNKLVADLAWFAKSSGCVADEELSWDDLPDDESLHTTTDDIQARGIEMCGLLYAGYHVGAWHWEFVELLRKLILTSLIIFIDPGGPLQIICALLVVFLVLVMNLKSSPFMDDRVDLLSQVVQIQLFLTLVIGLMLFYEDAEGADDDQTIIDLLLVLDDAGESDEAVTSVENKATSGDKPDAAHGEACIEQIDQPQDSAETVVSYEPHVEQSDHPPDDADLSVPAPQQYSADPSVPAASHVTHTRFTEKFPDAAKDILPPSGTSGSPPHVLRDESTFSTATISNMDQSDTDQAL
ncbi:hypothetical protein CYMTET_10676, partial [Cymbomonas tetramitiformis]